MKRYRFKSEAISLNGEELWYSDNGWTTKDKAQWYYSSKEVKNITLTQPVVCDVFMYCDSCGKELLPVSGCPTEYQFSEALWIEFKGGYGMFIDNTGPFYQETTGVICCSCARELMERYEWIQDLLSGINIIDAEAAWERHMERLVEET